MLAFEDLLLAKVFAEDQILPVDLLKKMVVFLDGQGGSLVSLMISQGFIPEDDPRLESSKIKTERYLFMMKEAIFAEMLRQSGALTSDLFGKLKKFQKREGYSRSMKEILERSGHLQNNPQILDVVEHKTIQRLTKHREGIILKYRHEDFAGIARPLTKQSKNAESVEITRAPSSPKIKLPTPKELNRQVTPFPPSHRNAGPQYTYHPSPDSTVEAPRPIQAPAASQPSSLPPPLLDAPEAQNVAQQSEEEKNLQNSHKQGHYVDRGTMAMTVPDIHDIAGNSDDPYVGVVVGDTYKFIKRLGQGAMGVVYLAQALDRDELVAVKLILDAEKNPEAVSRFKREILASSFFDHPNTVQIYDQGETGAGAQYIVLEYVRGEEVRVVLKREKRFSKVLAVDLIVQLLEGLAAVHRGDVIHKDLKPENLMLTARNGQPFLKIMDFGLARILNTQDQVFSDQIYMTRDGQISGSPAYIAPETISEDTIGRYTDIYSVGITFFEFLTGTLPYGARSLREHIMGHLYKNAQPLEKLYPQGNFPPAMQLFIDRCLKKKPKERFQSCEEALAFIKEHIEPAVLAEEEAGA
ncbi:MAG: serine/threonine-protein kinase [Planctomycetota bacterium]|nr:serine/threonine-protein kinase [Planctomycetota bacterium]